MRIELNYGKACVLKQFNSSTCFKWHGQQNRMVFEVCVCVGGAG